MGQPPRGDCGMDSGNYTVGEGIIFYLILFLKLIVIFDNSYFIMKDNIYDFHSMFIFCLIIDLFI